MKKFINYILPAILLFGSCKDSTSNKYPEGIEHIVIIGVDGMSPDGIRNAKTPVMHNMISNGSIKWDVRTVLPSSSSQNWASMISGAGREQHGVLDNDWERNDHTLPPVIADNENIFPTIFEVIRKNKPDAEIGTVYNWKGFGRLFEKSAVNYDTTFASVDSTTTSFINYLSEKKPLFSFIHMDHVDHAGHEFGHGSDNYYRAVAKADTLIGKILSAIEKSGMMDKTLVIVTADHGGKGYGHGGATPEEAEIAMIFFGKGVKQGYEIKQPVYTYDLAATIAFCLGITPPYAWIGRSVKSAFEGFPEPSNLWKGKKTILSPVIFPKPHLYEYAGGLYIDTPAVVKIEPQGKGNIIRYTLNGQEPDTGSPVYTEPFIVDSTTVVKAKSFDGNGNESLVTTAYFRVSSSGTDKGLHAAFFIGKGWKSLPDFSKLHPGQKWRSNEFELNRDKILPLLKGDVFGVVFDGKIAIRQSGDYTFYTESDDGSKLYIDDKEVVDNDGSHGVISNSGDVHLEKGKHSIRVEYFNSEGGFWLNAFYKGPGIPKQIIPANILFQ